MKDLFGQTRSRAKPRKMMHVIDAGEFPDGRPMVSYKCQTCGYMTGQVVDKAKKRPCPKCNAGGERK